MTEVTENGKSGCSKSQPGALRAGKDRAGKAENTLQGADESSKAMPLLRA